MTTSFLSVRSFAIILILPFCSLSLFATAFPAGNHAEAPPSSVETYQGILEDLNDHILEIKILNDADFENNHALLNQHISVLGTDMESVTMSFELISTFEEEIGPLFTTDNTRNGFNRDYTSDGLNLHRNIIVVHQGLIDHAYNNTWLSTHPELLEGRSFDSHTYFPGAAEKPEDVNAMETATVKCSYMLGNGSQPWGEIGNPNVVRPTGCYLSPGSIAEITVPESLIGQGIKIRIGAHFWDLENKSRYKRMDRVSITYDISNTTTKIAHPLGGGIYIEVPLGVDEGLVDVELKNVVRSPFFSLKSFHETSLSEWQEVERNRPAPWTDFETDRFMMQVPTSWIYAFDDPKFLLEAWDKSMDVVSDLLGRPRVVDRHKNYLQFDVIIRGSAYHPGYPMSNTPYDPNAQTDGTPNHNILRGPEHNQDIHFHELGHEVAISKFVGEVEAIVNFLYVPVLNKCYGMSLDEAFQRSFGPSYGYFATKDNTTRTRLVADTFHEGLERNTCNCTMNEVRYQHRGYAHYVDIVELYGWEALERFWQSESEAADMGNPFPINNQAQDDRIFRMSQAAGVDLRPLFHFWGIIPHDQETLAQHMEEEGLKLPMDIKEKLHHYRSLIPVDNDEFVSFGNELYDDFLNYSGTQFDFGPGWYQQRAKTYDEAQAAKVEQALSDIIIYYYGTDCFEVDSFLVPEFDLPTELCRSDFDETLPPQAINGVEGNWAPAQIETSEIGTFQSTFTPILSECAVETLASVDIYSIDVPLTGDSILCHGSTNTMMSIPGFISYIWTLDGFDVPGVYSVDIEEAGTLYLSVVDIAGCLGEVELEMTENPAIEIAVDVTNPLCHGETGSALISANGGTGSIFAYSIDGTNLAAGNHNVVVTDSIGCMDSLQFTVEQPDLLTIDYIDGEIVISGGVPPYALADIITDNILYVSVIDANDCEVSAEFMFTDIEELDVKSLSLFPNPTSGLIHVVREGQQTFESVKLLSADGKLIRNLPSQVNSFDLSDMPEGMYILHININDGTYLAKKIFVVR